MNPGDAATIGAPRATAASKRGARPRPNLHHGALEDHGASGATVDVASGVAQRPEHAVGVLGGEGGDHPAPR